MMNFEHITHLLAQSSPNSLEINLELLLLTSSLPENKLGRDYEE